MKKIKLIILFILLAILMFLLYFINSTPKSEAQTNVSEVTGYATIYNPETGGSSSPSIYFSSTSSGVMGGTSGNISYNVQYNSSTGAMTGNAWSPIYGWVIFNGNTANVPAFQNDGESSDWATGLIKLSGNDGGSTGNMPYSVTFNLTTGQGSGNAWGGNVLGWIDFSHVFALPGGSPIVNLTASPTSITVGSSSTLTWLGINLAPNGCVTSGGVGSWPVLSRPSSGSWNTGALPVGTYTFSIKCLGIGANSTVYSPTDTALVKVYPEGTCMDQTASNFGESLPCESDNFCENNPSALQCVCAVDPTLPQCFDFCLENPQICSAYCVANPTACEALCLVNQQICTGVKKPHFEEN
jgi:hypothetical protein